jgi:hypothetical protein
MYSHEEKYFFSSKLILTESVLACILLGLMFVKVKFPLFLIIL